MIWGRIMAERISQNLQSQLMEFLIRYVPSPSAKIKALTLDVPQGTLSLDLEMMQYSLQKDGVYSEMIPIYGGMTGLSNLLQSMVTGSSSEK